MIPQTITAFGESDTIANMAEKYGINYKTLYARLRDGLSPEEALTRATNFHSRTLCWGCKNVFCSWMQEFVPVKGWDAEKTTIKNSGVPDVQSFIVHRCPEFVRCDRDCGNV